MINLKHQFYFLTPEKLKNEKVDKIDKTIHSILANIRNDIFEGFEIKSKIEVKICLTSYHITTEEWNSIFFPKIKSIFKEYDWTVEDTTQIKFIKFKERRLIMSGANGTERKGTDE